MVFGSFRSVKRTTVNPSIGLGLAVLSFVYLALSFWSGFSALTIVLLFLFSFQLASFVMLAKFPFSLAARYLVLLGANLALFMFSVSFGEGLGFQHFYLSLAAMPLLFFEWQERRSFWAWMIAPLVLYAAVTALARHAYFDVHSGTIQSASFSVLYWILFPSRFAFFLIGALYISNANSRAQARINLMVSELRESDRTSRALLAAIPDIIYRVSGEGRFLDYHSPAEHRRFLPPETTVGRKLAEVLPSSIAEPLLGKVSDAIQWGTMQVLSFDTEAETDRRYFEARIAGAGDKDVLMIIQDVSERVRTEKIILDQKVKGATANKLAALGEMAGGIAHEINNPLAVIQGKVQQVRQLSERGALDRDSAEKLLERIDLTTLRISKIVKSLRFFARDGQGDPFELASARTIVEDTLEFCRERFRNQSIHLEIQAGPDDLMIECRAVQVVQVLLNLLNNAHDAVEILREKWINLSVDDLDQKVRISVTDSGAGIPSDLHEKIFQPFFTTKGIGKGTGLGLSISKGIIEAHQGTLQIDVDCPNTRFVIEIPKIQQTI